MFYFIFSDNAYTLCFFNVKATCEAHVISSHPDISKFECEEKCTEDEECQFIFYTEKFENCVLFQSCDATRIGMQIGHTYAKNKCSGILY